MKQTYKHTEKVIVEKKLKLTLVLKEKKELQYDEKHNKLDEKSQITIEQIEKQYRDSKNSLSEQEKNVRPSFPFLIVLQYKKLNTTLNEVINSVSRILY